MRVDQDSIINKRSVAVLLATLLAASVGLLASPAGAETVEVPITNVEAKGDPGSTVLIGSTDIAEDLQGRSCDVTITVKNQTSENPGNTLIVSSGDSSVRVEGIEDTANAITEASGTLTLGPSINVSVQLGNANITSLGSSLTVTCEPLPVTPPTPPVVTDPTYTG